MLFLQGLLVYPKYFPITSPLELALGQSFGRVCAGLAIAALLWLAWRNRASSGDSPEFALTLAAFFLGAALIMPLLTPFNQVILILPALMILRHWDCLGRLSRAALITSFGWPWIAQIALLLFPPNIHSTDRWPLAPSWLVLFVPFVLLTVLATMPKTLSADSHGLARA